MLMTVNADWVIKIKGILGCDPRRSLLMDIKIIFVNVGMWYSRKFNYSSCFFYDSYTWLQGIDNTYQTKSEDNESDEEMEGLCQRGLDTECCVFCKVIRVS